MKLESHACTHVGRRANNEDAFCAHAELGLFVVADGMGGYEGGEVASQLTTGTITDFVRRNDTDADSTWPFALDRRQLEAALHAPVADETFDGVDRDGAVLVGAIADRLAGVGADSPHHAGKRVGLHLALPGPVAGLLQ